MRHPKRRDTWVTSYADLITQLLVFFIVILSASQISAKKIEQIQQSIDGGQARKTHSLDKLTRDLKQALKIVGLASDVTLMPDREGVALTIKDSLLFESGSADISPDKSKRFAVILKSLRELPLTYQFTIEGHTDDAPIVGGRFASNWELSAQRAISVLALFTTQGFSPLRLSVQGFADQRPVVANRTLAGLSIPANQQKNRRVVIRVK